MESSKKEKKKAKDRAGRFIPGTHFDQADVAERVNNLKKMGATEEEIETWVHQFNAEYYSNDHDLEGSLFRERIPGYDTEILTDHKSFYNKDITLQQLLFANTNGRNVCALNQIYKKADSRAREKSGEENTEEVISYIPHEEDEISLGNKLDDRITLAPILGNKLNKLKYVYDDLINVAIAQIEEDVSDIKEIINILCKNISILTLKGVYVKKEVRREEAALKVKKPRNRKK